MTTINDAEAPTAGATTADATAADSGVGERATPFYCPYCGDEDLRPHGATGGSWHCRACARVFTLKFVGVEVS